MDGGNTFWFPFRVRPIFRCHVMLVSGSVALQPEDSGWIFQHLFSVWVWKVCGILSAVFIYVWILSLDIQNPPNTWWIGVKGTLKNLTSGDVGLGVQTSILTRYDWMSRVCWWCPRKLQLKTLQILAHRNWGWERWLDIPCSSSENMTVDA